MADRQFILNLIEVVEELKQRVIAETAIVERVTGDDFIEEKAELRNLVMQLDGLKLKLLKTQRH